MRDAGAKINYAIVNTAPTGLILFYIKEFARMAQHVRFVTANISISSIGISIYHKRVTALLYDIVIIIYNIKIYVARDIVL